MLSRRRRDLNNLPHLEQEMGKLFLRCLFDLLIDFKCMQRGIRQASDRRLTILFQFAFEISMHQKILYRRDSLRFVNKFGQLWHLLPTWCQLSFPMIF